MNQDKQLMMLIFGCILNLDDEDIDKLKTGKYRLVCEEIDKERNNINIFSNEIENICIELLKCKSRDELLEMIDEHKLTKEKLTIICKYYEIYVGKNYTKDKIIDRIVDRVIGIREGFM